MKTLLRSDYMCGNLVVEMDMCEILTYIPSCEWLEVKEYEKYRTAHCNGNYNNNIVIVV